MKYVERKNTGCEKWDGLTDVFGADNLLPLWVADMDFRVDENIIRAVSEYLQTGVFGYYRLSDDYYDAFIQWEKREHDFSMKREWIRYVPGVVAGFHFAMNVLTEPGDAVIVNTPVYYPFFRAVNNNSCKLVCSELINNEGRYEIDFDDFERRIEEDNVKVYLMCSPHNPVGRVWREDEIMRILDICRRHGTAIISDEIHHDLVFEGSRHIPTLKAADAEDRIIMLTSASKTFNIAGLQNASAVIMNNELADEWDSFVGTISVTEGSSVSYIASQAAYIYGREWLDELKSIVRSNYDLICERLKKSLPEVVITPLEGTYLMWIDFGAYFTQDELQTFMQEKCGLAFDYGSWFGGERSGSFIRVNLATSRENIEKMTDSILTNI